MRTRLGSSPLGFLNLSPVVRRILAVTFGVWAVQIVFGLAGIRVLDDWFALDPHRALPWRPWQFVSYIFLHSAPGQGGGFTPLHILLNMFSFVMFAPEVERVLGGRAFLRFYLICGAVGGLLTLLPPFQAVTVGASGAVLGVLTAFGLLFPDRPVLVLVFWVPAKFVVIGIAIMQLASAAGVQTGISYIAHVGGMGAAYVLLRGQPLWHRWAGAWNERRAGRARRRRADARRHVNDLLDKLNREGRDGLTQEDWRALLEESKRSRDDD